VSSVALTIDTSCPNLKFSGFKESTPAPDFVLHRGSFSGKPPQMSDKPILLVDVDGVVSLFGFSMDECPSGTWHIVEGIAHFLSATAASYLHELAEWFDPVWCSGWEEKAAEHLPALLGVPVLPHLSFDRNPGRARAHWKLAAIDAHAGDRPLAWVDDALDEACEDWAAARPARTLLVRTEPAVGLTEAHVALLKDWARP
jgi:hypothetical protein